MRGLDYILGVNQYVVYTHGPIRHDLRIDILTPFVSSIADYQNLKEDSNKKPSKNADIVDCDFDKGPGPEQICKVNVEGLFQGPCTNETQYGWKAGTPCIAIKMNKASYRSMHLLGAQCMRGSRDVVTSQNVLRCRDQRIQGFFLSRNN